MPVYNTPVFIQSRPSYSSLQGERLYASLRLALNKTERTLKNAFPGITGIGGDPIHGMGFIDCLKLFEEDEATNGISMIGGTAEEEVAAFICSDITKPVVAYLAGVTAPPGKRMGHADVIIAGGKGTAKDKYAALNSADINTVYSPAHMGQAMQDVIPSQHLIFLGINNR